jgi:hypothetical protein
MHKIYVFNLRCRIYVLLKGNIVRINYFAGKFRLTGKELPHWLVLVNGLA